MYKAQFCGNTIKPDLDSNFKLEAVIREQSDQAANHEKEDMFVVIRKQDTFLINLMCPCLLLVCVYFMNVILFLA